MCLYQVLKLVPNTVPLNIYSQSTELLLFIQSNTVSYVCVRVRVFAQFIRSTLNIRLCLK